jgi:hypothetical protein
MAPRILKFCTILEWSAPWFGPLYPLGKSPRYPWRIIWPLSWSRPCGEWMIYRACQDSDHNSPIRNLLNIQTELSRLSTTIITTGSSPEPDESRQQSLTLFLIDRFYIILPFTSGSSNRYFIIISNLTHTFYFFFTGSTAPPPGPGIWLF